MKIALAIKGNNISMHYGHSEGFAIYEVNDHREIVDTKQIMNGGIKGRETAKLLADYNVKIIIVGGIGKSAKQHLEEELIEVKVGANGNLETIISSFLNNTLELDETLCNEDGHEHHGESYSH